MEEKAVTIHAKIKSFFPDTLKEDKILPYKWRETIKHTAFTHSITV